MNQVKSLLFGIVLLLPIVGISQTTAAGFSPNTRFNPNTISIETGIVKVRGDVGSKLLDGKTIGIAYQRLLNRFLSLEAGYIYSIGRGVDDVNIGENIYNGAPWRPNHQYKLHQLDLLAGIHKTVMERVEIRAQYGIGLYTHSTSANYLDAAGQPYQDASQSLDATYETGGFIKNGIFRVNDVNFILSHNLSLRVGYAITSQLSIGLSSDFIFSDNDYIDGVKQRSSEDITSDTDIVSRLTLSASYSL